MDDLVRLVDRAGVDVACGARAGTEELADGDAVVMATGARWERTGESPSRPDRDGIPGAELDHVLDVGTALRRALEDPTSLGRRVLVVDDTGGYLPFGLAEVLADAGVAVEVVSP